MLNRWVPRNNLSASEISELKEVLGITNELFVHVLWNRGVRTREHWENLVHGGPGKLHSPFEMKDMDLAVRRVMEASNKGQRILVYGDYDVDGTTSVAMMYHFLDSLGIPCSYYIPDRYKEGYGISKQGIDFALDNAFDLVIALDCGVRSVDLIRYAQENNLDFIVCDHHIPGKELPPAVAVLNPKREDCKYPFKELSGCGIGFKLIQALVDSFKLEPAYFEQYYDLVAVSIASDLVPMTGENRELMKLGLNKLMTNPIPGFQLITATLENKQLSVSNIVFMIGPRINAAGRMASGMDAVRMMLARDPGDVSHLTRILNEYNDERKHIDQEITSQALEMIRAEPGFNERYSTVVYQEQWHKGVVGIVASRLLEKHYRPTIVLTRSGDKITGSARSIEGFNIHDALEECSEHLVQFGGHYFAAGMSLNPDKLEKFKEAFEGVAQRNLHRDQLTRNIYYDCEVSLENLSLKVYESLEKIAPFGPENPKPMFITRGLYDTGNSRRIGSDKSHLRLELEDRERNTRVAGVAFGMGDTIALLQSGPVDVIYHIKENHYNGRITMQLEVHDIIASENLG